MKNCLSPVSWQSGDHTHTHSPLQHHGWWEKGSLWLQCTLGTCSACNCRLGTKLVSCSMCVRVDLIKELFLCTEQRRRKHKQPLFLYPYKRRDLLDVFKTNVHLCKLVVATGHLACWH